MHKKKNSHKPLAKAFGPQIKKLNEIGRKRNITPEMHEEVRSILTNMSSELAHMQGVVIPPKTGKMQSHQLETDIKEKELAKEIKKAPYRDVHDIEVEPKGLGILHNSIDLFGSYVPKAKTGIVRFDGKNARLIPTVEIAKKTYILDQVGITHGIDRDLIGQNPKMHGLRHDGKIRKWVLTKPEYLKELSKAHSDEGHYLHRIARNMIPRGKPTTKDFEEMLTHFQGIR